MIDRQFLLESTTGNVYDKHLISAYNITPESHIQALKWSLGKEPFDRQINSPCQHLGKHVEKSIEDRHTDVRV